MIAKLLKKDIFKVVIPKKVIISKKVMIFKKILSS